MSLFSNSVELYDSVRGLRGNSSSNYAGQVNCVAQTNNIYEGQVTLITGACKEELEDEFPCFDISRGGYTCRGILFSIDENGNARDILNEGLNYERLPKFDRDAKLKLPFQVDDCISLEPLLTMDPSMFDLDSIVSNTSLTEQDRAFFEGTLKQTKVLLERLKFGSQLTPYDIARIRQFFLTNNNVYKLAGLFGERRYSMYWTCRKDYVKNDIGPLFPVGYFGNMTAEDYWEKLTHYSYLSFDLSKYEKPKSRGKYFKE